MPDVPPGAVQQPRAPQQQPPVPPIDIAQMMQMYDPEQLRAISQALEKLLKIRAALQPRPSPQQQAMQPGPLQQLAMADLQRRQQEQMQMAQRMAAQG